MQRNQSALRAALLGCSLTASMPSFAVAQGPTERLAREYLQARLGTLSTRQNPSFADGQLNGCSLEFSVLAQDWIYKRGDYIIVSGSFGLLSAKGKVAAVLKVVLQDLDLRTMNTTPSPPASAYFISGNSTTRTAVVSSYPSDQPGAIFVVFQLDPTLSVIAEGLAKDAVTIGFARTKGASDVVVSIDPTIASTAADGQRTRSPKATSDFIDCGKTLIEAIK